MNPQTSSNNSVQTRNGKSRIVFPLIVLLLVIALGVFLASNFDVVKITGKDATYVLDANKTRLGILIIDENATALFSEKSHWIGPVISKEGALIVQDDVTITGPVVLFSNSLQLGKDATVDGNLVLFAGSLTLKPGAMVRHNVVLFAGSASLEQGARIRGDVIAFAGSVVLHEKATLRGDAMLFAGSMQIGPQTVVVGKPVLFAGSLDLGSKAVIHDDVVLFAGGVNLSPEARVKGDVVVTNGNATLDSQSIITGQLYMNSQPAQGHLHRSSEAQIMGGLVKLENIEAVAVRYIAGGLLLQIVKFTLLPIGVICILMVLMFYMGRQIGPPKGQSDAKANYPESMPHSTPAGLTATK